MTETANPAAELPKIFEKDFFLTPAECNPEQRMPITLLINRLVEVATLHANVIGIGYASLVERNESWVLSRVAVELSRYPGVNETYRISTWICGINRLFSERDFEISVPATGEVIGHARTVWAVINTETRAGADISRMEWISSLVPDKVCPVEKPSRLRPLKDFLAVPYRFTYCDLDFNRHVNSARYIELLLNQWSLEFHDAYRLTRFEIAYMRQAYYGEEVEVRMADVECGGDTTETHAELVYDGLPLCRALLRFSPR